MMSLVAGEERRNLRLWQVRVIPTEQKAHRTHTKMATVTESCSARSIGVQS